MPVLDIGLAGKAIAGALLGLGLLWWLIKRLNRGEADRVEAISLKAHTQGQIEADAATKAAQLSAQAAKDAAKDAPATDW